MTATERQFLAAAAAAPADDQLRLVYSDWLEEQAGDAATAQAEFVRLQVRRAQLQRDDPTRPVPRSAREALLERKYRRKWNGRLHRLLHEIGVPHKVDSRRGFIRGWQYTRGMVGSVTLPADSLTGLFWAVPQLGPVRRVVCTDWPPADPETTTELFFGKSGPKLLALTIYWGFDLDYCAALVGRVPVIDLRALSHRRVTGSLLVRNAGLVARYQPHRKSVVLFPRPYDDGQSVCRLDPHDVWPQYRAEFAELTGYAGEPALYQG